MPDLALDLLDNRPLRRHTGSGKMPHASVRVGRKRQARDDRTYIRHEDKLVGRIERANHVRNAAVHGRGKCGMQEALVDAGTVEVWQAQDSRLNLPLSMRGQEQILLGFAHPAFEGMRLARMVLANRPRSRPPIRIDGAYENDPLDARRDRAIECLFHQARMQLELPVVHANEVDNRVDAGRRCLHRRRIVGIPGDNLGERIAAEGCSQRISRSADHSIWPTLGADRLRDALADRPGGTKERDLVHGRRPCC